MPERSIQVNSVGKTIKKILIGIALIVTAGLLIPIVLSKVLLFALLAVQLLGVSTVFNAFTPDFDTGEGGRLLSKNLSIFSSPTVVRGIVFGRAGFAGQVLFRANIRNSGSTPDELLIILGLAGYPATSLEKFWLNEELVFDGDSTTGPGAITTGKFADDLWVWFRTGEETSAAFPDIATLQGDWDAKTRILRGIPSIGIRLKIREELDNRFQPLAQIKGSKLYDPRLDSTIPGGSGTHRFADPSTWEFSVNPKLAELLYLRGADVNGTRIFGMGKPAAAIDLENFAAEANVCEEQINVVGGGTIDRYTCNGLLIPNSSHKINLQRLLSASAGTIDASGGIYRTFAGAWRASSMTLTETDIDGAPTDMQLQIDPSKEINVIGGAFAEPAEMWVVKEYPELTDAASITLFGENSKKLDLPFTTDHRIAQRISKIQMKRLNAKRAFNANYWLRTVSLQPGDIITQTYARYRVVAETFRVDFWALEASEDREGSRRLLVAMRLIEELQSWFDWNEATEEKAISAGGILPATGAPRITEVFYIKPITGTAIQNGVGTLTVEAHRIFEGVDELLSTGTIQLFEGTTLITVANGYAAGSDGYTGVFDSGDISGSAIVELKDGPSGAILDSITLVDVIDGTAGDDAIYGSIDPENGLAWTQAVNGGPWTPSQLTSDLDCTFYQAGVAVARIARRITLASGTGFLSSTTVAHKDGDLNTSRVTVTVSGGGSQAISVEFAYSFGGELATVAETLKSVQGGDDGAAGDDGLDAVSGFIEPENGLAWVRATTGGAWTPSQLTTDLDCTFVQGGVDVARIARRVTLTAANGTLAVTSTAHKGGDLNTGRVTVTVLGGGSTAVNVQFDYSFGGDTGSDSATVSSAQGGDDGVLHYLTNEAHVVPANFDGTGYDTAFPGAGGTHKVFEGTADKTTSSTHSVVAPATKNGLTISVVSGTGVYSLSGASWVTDAEIFTLRAVFNGVNYDKTYSIAKSKQGADGGCALDTLTSSSLSDVSLVGWKLHTDGTIDTREGASYVNKETWIGACANSQYECFMTLNSGVAPSGPALDTWHLCSTIRTWELSTGGPPKGNNLSFKIRRISDNTVLKTVTVGMALTGF